MATNGGELALTMAQREVTLATISGGSILRVFHFKVTISGDYGNDLSVWFDDRTNKKFCKYQVFI